MLAEPQALLGRNLARGQRSDRDVAHPQPALPADVDSGVVAGREHQFLVVRRPAQQHPPVTAQADPDLSTGFLAAIKDHLMSLWHQYVT